MLQQSPRKNLFNTTISSNLRCVSANKWLSLMIDSTVRLKKLFPEQLPLLKDIVTTLQGINASKFHEHFLKIRSAKSHLSEKVIESFINMKDSLDTNLYFNSSSIEQDQRENEEELENQKQSFFQLTVTGLASRLEYNSKQPQTPKTILPSSKEKLFSPTTTETSLEKGHKRKNGTQTRISKQKRQSCSIRSATFNNKKSDSLKIKEIQQWLVQQFQSKTHPFKIIFDTLLFIMEHKYKILIKKEQSIQITKKLKTNINLMKEFFLDAAIPYLSILKEQEESKEVAKKRLKKIMNSYIQKHQLLNNLVRKILRGVSRLGLQKRIALLPQYTTIQEYDVSPELAIEGNFISTMTFIMQFAQAKSAAQARQLLKTIKKAIRQDIDIYYQTREKSKRLMLTSEGQIEIIRFCIKKVKDWLSEIYSQLLYLELMHENIFYAFGEVSQSFTHMKMATLSLLELKE